MHLQNVHNNSTSMTHFEGLIETIHIKFPEEFLTDSKDPINVILGCVCVCAQSLSCV